MVDIVDFVKLRRAGFYDVIRIDLAERVTRIFDYNETRNSAEFLLVYNTAYWLATKHGYYTRTVLADAVTECKPALDDFMAERENGQPVSLNTMLRIAMHIGRIRDCLLDVRIDHYNLAAKRAWEFSIKGQNREPEENTSADSHKPRKAVRRLRRAVHAVRCHRFARRELSRADTHSGRDPGSSARHAT